VAKGTKINWQRIPNDKARRYWNADNHAQIISRRYYDEHFGRLAGTGLTNETFASKNKAENPLLSALRPRRGKQSPARNYSKLKQHIFGSKRLAHNKNNIYIGSFEFAPELSIFLEVFYTALKYNPRMLYYLETVQVDEYGAESTTSQTRYAYLPKTVDAMLELFDTFDAFELKYKLRVTSIIFNYRFKDV
jgi:hypothetical protein